jgi:hydrogenase maturation protease
VKRIVCVGNALRDGDRTGPEAFALLQRTGWPAGVEVVDGGLSGLDLLRVMDGTQSVVFIDSVRGFGGPGEVVVLEPHEVVEGSTGGFDHASGLSYLLGVYGEVLSPPLPHVRVVGVEEPADGDDVAEAVRIALSIVAEVAAAAQTE